MRSWVIILPVVLIAGCGDLEPQTEPITQAEVVPETAQEIEAKSAEMPTLPAESPERLVEAYRIAFLRGDTESISKMIYWGDQPPNEYTIDARLWANLARKGPGKTITVEIREVTTDPSAENAHTLTPIKTLHGYVRREDDNGSVGGDVIASIGQIDGQFYFCVPKK